MSGERARGMGRGWERGRGGGRCRRHHSTQQSDKRAGRAGGDGVGRHATGCPQQADGVGRYRHGRAVPRRQDSPPRAAATTIARGPAVEAARPEA